MNIAIKFPNDPHDDRYVVETDDREDVQEVIRHVLAGEGRGAALRLANGDTLIIGPHQHAVVTEAKEQESTRIASF